jgi:hypothetical protein
MHASRVLLALQEQEKWRERRRRLEERLRQIRARKRYFLRELDTVRQKAAQFGALLVRFKGGVVDEAEALAYGLGTLR